MSSRASTLDIRNVSNILVEVDKWETLGINLGLKKYKLKEIDRSKLGDIALCRLDLIDLWLRSDIYASWEKLIEALTKMDDYSTTIERIRTEFLQGGIPGGVRPRGMGPGGMGPGGMGPGGRNTSGTHQTIPTGARIVTDSSFVSHPGVRQPVVPQVSAPEDEIRRAQRMIDSYEGDEEAENRLVKMVSELTNWNFDIDTVDKKDPYKCTLLHYSSMRGDLESVKALIVLGANVNSLNASNQTPLDTAMMAQKTNVAEFLKEVGGLVYRAIENMNSKVVPMEDHQEYGDDQMREEVGIRGEHLILTLDSSSTMALIQLETLSQIEKATGKKIPELFEWIVASGVGGFLMMAMVYCKKSIAELRRIYFRLREKVFCGQAPEERGRELEAFAVEIFGSTRRMVDVVDLTGPKLLISAVNKLSTDLNPIFFNNFQGEYSTMHVWKVARYTCATPLYIGECDNFIDGGAVCKNPSVTALGNIREYYKMQSTGIGGIVSIGDGLMPGMPLAKLDGSNYYSHFLLSKENALSEEIARSCASVCEAGNLYYNRFNVMMKEYMPIPEEATLEQLIQAVICVISYYQKEDSDIQNFSRRLNNDFAQ